MSLAMHSGIDRRLPVEGPGPQWAVGTGSLRSLATREQLDLTAVPQLEHLGIQVPVCDEAAVAALTLTEARNGVFRHVSVDIVEHKA